MRNHLGCMPEAPHDSTPQANVWPRGSAVRERRVKRGLKMQEAAALLGVPYGDVSILESSNLPLPPAWVHTLQKAGVVDANLPAGPAMSGMWMRAHRLRTKRDQSEVAGVVGSLPNTIAAVETRDWPVPPEWVPKLCDLFDLDPQNPRPPTYQEQVFALTRSMRRKIATDLLRQGASMPAILRATGLKNRSHVFVWAQRLGLKAPVSGAKDGRVRARYSSTPKDRAEAVRRVRAGETQKDVAKSMGFSPWSIGQWLAQAKYEEHKAVDRAKPAPPPPKPTPPPTPAPSPIEMRIMFADGYFCTVWLPDMNSLVEFTYLMQQRKERKP